jgi:hypothetical protein
MLCIACLIILLASILLLPRCYRECIYQLPKPILSCDFRSKEKADSFLKIFFKIGEVSSAYDMRNTSMHPGGKNSGQPMVLCGRLENGSLVKLLAIDVMS